MNDSAKCVSGAAECETRCIGVAVVVVGVFLGGGVGVGASRFVCLGLTSGATSHD